LSKEFSKAKLAKRIILKMKSVVFFLLIHFFVGYNAQILLDEDNQLFSSDFKYDIDLKGQWQLTNANGSVSTTGIVPGNVHMDLLRNGLIDDPYYRYNDVDYRWIGADNWVYYRTFDVTSAILQKKQIVLVCEGIDTVSKIRINKQDVGKTDNMFRRYMFDITSLLEAGSNSITIEFTSAIAYSAKKFSEYPYFVNDGSYDPNDYQHGERNRNFIRKEQCSFSWDWGPCFVPMGIWQPIGILAFSDARITYVTPQIFPISIEDGSFNVQVDTYLEAGDSTQVKVDIEVNSVKASSGMVTVTKGENIVTVSASVSGVNLWWPTGYGDPNLYELKVSVKNSAGNEIDKSKKEIGFRSVQVITEPIQGQQGATFYFNINGVAVFAKGANWIPADSFENRVTLEVLQGLLQSAKDANMNIVRNWGGGIYQHDEFYTICDQMGLMVWEEFMFACAMYPRDVAFLNTVSDEVAHQIRRLSYHPSIILWSGNNENEAALTWYPDTIANRDLYVVDYSKLYYDTVHSTLALYDTSRPFWPSSPSNGFTAMDPLVGVWGNVYNESIGDVHWYNYDMMCTNVTYLPNSRFVSEYGFQSFPSLESFMPVTLPEDWYQTSPVMEHRQHHPDGTPQLLGQILMHFAYIETGNSTLDFENFIYLSQCVQSLCISFESEHYRRGKGLPAQTMGAIYWQLNDIWQAPTWSSLEYGGKWKMLHYSVKRSFASVMVSSYEGPYDDAYQVFLTSDLMQPINGVLSVELYNWNGLRQNTWNTTFALEALGSEQLWSSTISSMTSSQCQRNECFVYLSAYDTSQNLLATNTFWLSNFSQVALQEAELQIVSVTQVSSSTASITVHSSAVAPYVMLSSGSIRGRFSDNSFLMFQGQEVTLTFYGWQSFTADQLQSALTIKSLGDTY